MAHKPGLGTRTDRRGAVAARLGFSAALLAGALVLSGTAMATAADCRANAAAGIDWQECDKKLLILSGSDLGGANLSAVDFTSTDLRQANLLAANLEKATLVRASLANAKAAGANFTRIEAYRTNFTDIDAQGATFTSAEIQRSVFAGAKLNDVDFTKAELGRAEFQGADVSGAKFSLANLARADFRTARLGGANDFASSFFFLTRIEGVDLSQASGLTQWQVDMACGDAQTKLPAGVAPPASWPCKFEND